MHEGHARFWWGHTAKLCALIANVNRGPNAAPFRDEQFNPYASGDGDAHEEDAATPEDLQELRALLEGMRR